jgi:hypothetical protein
MFASGQLASASSPRLTAVKSNARISLTSQTGMSSENIADAIAGNVPPGRAESIARGILQRLKKAEPAG